MCGGHVGQNKHAAHQNMQSHANDKVQAERREAMITAGRQNEIKLLFTSAHQQQLYS